ncbi:MAG: hypothetical protein Q8S71_03710 [Hydrogenophaga sp.]|nr:hypothetical protein [Hydrogenophaga sp.]
MAQSDMQVADQDGASFLVDINSHLAAIVSNYSGATEPATMTAFQWWADTSSGLMKQRNAANNAWVNKGLIANAQFGVEGGTFTGDISVPDEAYGAGWNGSLEVPTKNAIYDKIETIGALVVDGFFYKKDTNAVAFTKTAAGTISIKALTQIYVAGTLVSFATDTAITMPTLTAGTDYAIYACTDGTIRADASFSFPTGYTALNSRKIGGFHYAPGGNAAARAGGDTTPAINEYSIWDLKFKPASPDPRGQMLVSGGFWADIYPLGVDHIINGTSKFNVTIADGSSPPKVPTQFGGNGTTTYTTLTWWESAEVLAAYGKRLPTYAEFAALAFGTTEATSGGTDPVSTILRAAFTSKWGAILATGNMWFWGANFGGGAAGAAWTANTTGRGSTYQMENAAIFGGSWVEASNSGSRASYWSNSPTLSYTSIGARGVCDHVVLE